MTKRTLLSALLWLTAVIAGLGYLRSTGRAEETTPPRSATGALSRSSWWEGMAGNSWSPQNAVAHLVGKKAADCGQFGPDATEAQLASAIACAEAASRSHKSFFTIRHFLG